MTQLVADPPGRQGPGPMQGALVEALDLVLARRASGALPGERRAAGRGTGTELAQIRPVPGRRRRPPDRRRRERPHGRTRTSATTSPSAR